MITLFEIGGVKEMKQMKQIESFINSGTLKVLQKYKAYLEFNYYPNQSNKFGDEIVGEISNYKTFLIFDSIQSNKAFYRRIEHYYNRNTSLGIGVGLIKEFNVKVIISKRIRNKYYSVFMHDYIPTEILSLYVSYLRSSQIKEIKSIKDIIEGDTLFVVERKIFLDDVGELSGIIEGLVGTLYVYEMKEVF